MIITDNFVVLNFQKTGSSFVRKVVKDIFLRRRNKNLILRALYKYKILHLGFEELRCQDPLFSGYKDQHGCFDQVPEKHKNKLIVSVIRDPYSRLKSIYNFKWWAKQPPISKEEISQYFPDFPDISLKEYFMLQNIENERLKKIFNIPKELVIGNQTIYFIRFYFRNHKRVLSNLTEDYIISNQFKEDLCNIKFLNNKFLNTELGDFLSNYNFSKEELIHVYNHDKVNVTKTKKVINEDDSEITDYVNKYEWLLLEIMSKIGYNFKKP